jgi:hypothetical protein
MATYTYDDILKRVESNGALNLSNANIVEGAIELQIQQLQPIDFPMKDLDYESTFSEKQQDITKVLSISQDNIGFINRFNNNPQLLLNSNRIVINSKRDYLMLFGKAGVALSSKNPINLDTDASTTLAAKDGLFLGVPNGGEPIKNNIKQPKTKGDPTPDQPYEPLVLGIKAANIIEDLLVILKNARIVTPLGIGYFREDAQYDLANLQARLPEIISTSTYIDGVSHETPDKAPSPPTTITNTTGTIIATGMIGGGGGGGFVGTGNDIITPLATNQNLTPIRRAIVDTATQLYNNPNRHSENPRDNMGWLDQNFQSYIYTVGWRPSYAWCNFFTNLVWKQAYDRISATDQKIAELYKSYLNGNVYGALSGNVFATLTNAVKRGFGKNFGSIGITDPNLYNYLRPGDMVVYNKGHINIAVSVDYDNLRYSTIGGNEGDQIKYYNPFSWGRNYTIQGIVRVVEPALFGQSQPPIIRSAPTQTSQLPEGKPPTTR